MNLFDNYLLKYLVQRIQYAKTKSDCVAKADGTYVPREKKKKQEEKGMHILLSSFLIDYA